MSENGANTTAKILKEIAAELQKIKEQAQLLQGDVRLLLERHWVLAASHITPFYENWFESVDASEILTLSFAEAQFQYLPQLCFPENGQAQPQFSFAEMEKHFSAELSQSIQLCLGSRELQLCEKEQMLILPFCLFDSVSAVMLARVRSFKTQNYPNYVASSHKFLDVLRHELFKPEWWDVIVLPKAE